MQLQVQRDRVLQNLLLPIPFFFFAFYQQNNKCLIILKEKAGKQQLKNTSQYHDQANLNQQI